MTSDYGDRGARDELACRRAELTRRGLAGANAYGLAYAIGGFAVGIVLASAGASALEATGGGGSRSLAGLVVRLVGLWLGLAGAALLAGRAAPAPERHGLGAQFGLAVRFWPDVPVGIVVGVACQFLLVPLLELPLVPIVPNLFHRVHVDEQAMTAHVHGPGLVVLGILLCVGSPLVEELFFRGLLLRALIGWFSRATPRAAVPAAVVVVAVAFGLAHFEALQLLALCGFGAVLCVLAASTGRLGAGIVAHAAFNTVAFVALVVHP